MATTFHNPYIGHPSQLLRINNYTMTGGLSHGMRATDIHNGPLQLTVCADKGMDFPYFSYRGVNLGYVAPCGLVHPSYFNDRGDGFLRGFFAGLLTTCGLTHMGAPSDADGVHYGLHGRVNNLPAEAYTATLRETGDAAWCEVSGAMRQAVLFGENITLQREVTIGCGERSFQFCDTVTNRSFAPQRHMILYHFNMGYPLLDEHTELLIPFSHVEPRDAVAETGMESRMEITAPTAGIQEMCYFYSLCKNKDGRTFTGVYNHELGIGVLIHFDGALLDHFTQWKMMGEGAYALGLEPGNATPMGVAKETSRGHVKYLQPWETRRYRFTVEILEGEQELQSAKAAMRALCTGDNG